MKTEPVLEGQEAAQKGQSAVPQELSPPQTAPGELSAARVTPSAELSAQVQLAKTDKHALNTLLHNYIPFIKKCVAGVFFKGQAKTDNLTDAMLAFTHSVQTYESENGAFIQYAATVIRNRLIDNARKELAAQKHFFSPAGEAPDASAAAEAAPPWEADVSLRAYSRSEEELNLRLEIEDVNSEFSQWGFSWASLLKKCPKQDRSRRVCLRIAEAVRESPELLADTLRNRQLPVARLAETFPRKALEKYRQYIAALIILLRGDYPYVYSFVPQPFSEERDV
jgi:RNA polymerase sigma factor